MINNKMEKKNRGNEEEAIKEAKIKIELIKYAYMKRNKLKELLKTETNESIKYNIEREIGDLNQFIINN